MLAWTGTLGLLCLLQVPTSTPAEDPVLKRARAALAKMAKSEGVQRAVFAQRLDVMQVGIVRFDPYLSTASLTAKLAPLTGPEGQPITAREREWLRMRSHFPLTYEPHLAGRYAIVMVCEVENPVEGHRLRRRLPLQFTRMDGRGENGSQEHVWNIELRARDAGEYEFFRMIVAIPVVSGPPPLLLAARLDTVEVRPRDDADRSGGATGEQPRPQ